MQLINFNRKQINNYLKIFLINSKIIIIRIHQEYKCKIIKKYKKRWLNNNNNHKKGEFLIKKIYNNNN